MRDPDCRFTLPEDAPWLANLAALWSVNPSLARRLENAADQDDTLPPRPELETVVLPDDTRLGEHFAYALQGFGPHVNDLFQRTGAAKGETILAVLEPDLVRLAGWLASTGFADAINSGRVVFFDKPDLATMQNVFGGVSLVVAAGFDVCENLAAQARCGDTFAAMAASLGELAEHHRTHLNTTVRFGRKSVENLLANLDHFVSAPGIERLGGVAAGRPAVLVAAGPSLRKNIEQLRGMEDRVVIIAVQTTLRPLLDAGVTPHFVCAIDHHEISTRFYENLPADLPTELVADPKTSGAVLRAWTSVPGRKLTLLGNDFADNLLRIPALAKAKLPNAATVAHLAFYLAEHLGCAQCLLIGQDLGFSDGLAYTPGTSYDDVWRPETGRFCSFDQKQWEHIARDRHALKKVSDWHGREMYTEHRLWAYLRQFEQMFAESSLQVVDATEGGVAKQHTVAMPLAEALTRFAQQPLEPWPDHPGTTPQHATAVRDALEQRAIEAEQIEAVSEQTVPLIEAIIDRAGDAAVVNHSVGRIDQLRRTLMEVDATYRLVTQITQHSERDRVQADMQIRVAEAMGRSAVDVRQQQARRDLANVRAIGEAARDLAKAGRTTAEIISRPAESCCPLHETSQAA